MTSFLRRSVVLKTCALSAALLMGTLLIGTLLAVAPARADNPFSFADTPGKLPKNVVPLHYAIELKPNLTALTVAGSEVIDIDVKEATDRLVINALRMSIASATVDGVGPAAIALDDDAQTATLTFRRPIAVGRQVLRIVFQAKIHDDGRGVYYADYQATEGRRRMIATHSEPTDARRIFPGWDEPAFKATFDLTVTVSQKFLAVANMPVAREVPIRGALKRVTFERTPLMSTYLFILVAGELERITAEAEGVTIGVVTTRGKTQKGRYALDEAAVLLKYFNDYFGVAYPLPKLDLIALPTNTASAMEHWGGITFYENSLFYDPATSTAGTQRRVFTLLAHEMAHQWFGNLVTMAWWNDLWLNEGFASWMQYKAAERFHPEWESWLRGNSSKQAAMAQDAGRGARAIRQPVANESEARAIFDTITYSKGQALVRMAETYLGEDVFRDAIRQYMKAHAYGNANTADLWRALEAVSGKPVGAVASAYTEQAGVPLVVAETSCVAGEQRIALTQDRFTIRDGEAKPQRWKVPVMLGPAGAAQASETVLLDGTGEVTAGRCGDPIKLNFGDVGYYRVRYDGTMQSALARVMTGMPPADRVNLLADAWALIESNRSPPAAFLDLADQLSGDDHRSVADQVIRVLSRMDQFERGRPARAAYRTFARATLRPVFDRVGWDGMPGEMEERALLRSALVRALGDLGDETILTEARKRFAAFLNDPKSLRPDLRDPVTHLVGRHADRAMYDQLLALARKTTNGDERTRYYSAIAGALDPVLARETLALTISEDFSTSRATTVIQRVASQGEHAELAWTFVQENYAKLVDKLGSNSRNRFLTNLMSNFSDRARADELKAFKPVHETSGGRMVAERAYEQILANADFVAQQLPAIDDWIKQRAAAQ